MPVILLGASLYRQCVSECCVRCAIAIWDKCALAGRLFAFYNEAGVKCGEGRDRQERISLSLTHENKLRQSAASSLGHFSHSRTARAAAQINFYFSD